MAGYTDSGQMRALKPEDYLEPACPLCGVPGMEPEIKPVPQQRIIEKMDEYMSRRDYAGAERHLLYWLEEARLGGDKRGELTILNELTGHYRKTGERERSLSFAEQSVELVRQMDFGDSISAGTTYVNAATANQAFGEYERALELFRTAQPIYEGSRFTRPELLGGLYNNMALTEQSLGKFREAEELFGKAIETMKKVPGGELEQAVTWVNLAYLAEAESGMEEGGGRIEACLKKADALLEETAAPRNGYYAFVCEKCAPGFRYFGFFLEGRKYERRAKEIYAQYRGEDGNGQTE